VTKGLTMLLGMSIAYLASFLGLILAWLTYRRRHQQQEKAK
jgi:ABC-type Fe3+ transport system permease subunit